MDMLLKGRVVLITGAGGGAGPTLARAFAAEGALVALHQREPSDTPTRADTTAAEITAEGGQALVVDADLGSTEAAAAMVARIERELGPVGVLVTATSA